MAQKRVIKATVVLMALIAVASCGGRGSGFGLGGPSVEREELGRPTERANQGASSIFDLLKPGDSDVNIKVNKYIWNASLEILDFLPVQSVDPFSGLIVTGYGTPPGGGRSYRATVYIKDPALDARSLNVALQTQGGRPVSESTTRAIEDAILTRARQLRIADGKL